MQSFDLRMPQVPDPMKQPSQPDEHTLLESQINETRFNMTGNTFTVVNETTEQLSQEDEESIVKRLENMDGMSLL
jgi:hypothetical protein